MTCPDYVEDFVFIKGSKRRVCRFWDFDNPGLCKCPKHVICSIYLYKNKLTDPWIIDFMTMFECILVREVI